MHGLLDGIYAFVHVFLWKWLTVTKWFSSLFWLLLISPLLQGRSRPAFHATNHREEALSLMVLLNNCECFSGSGSTGITGWLLKIDLFGCDMLFGYLMCMIIWLVVRVLGVTVSGLWKIIIDFEVNPVLGVRVVMEGFVDCALQSVFLLPFEEIEQSLIVPSSIPVSLARRCAHLTILLQATTDKKK